MFTLLLAADGLALCRHEPAKGLVVCEFSSERSCLRHNDGVYLVGLGSARQPEMVYSSGPSSGRKVIPSGGMR